MTTALGDTQLLQRPDHAARLKLGATLRYAYSTFSTYRDLFESAGVGNDDIDLYSPLTVLERLPVISADTLARVSEESLMVIDGIVDMETSSGTTGVRKKRFISYEDDRNDHEFMAELFRVAGIIKHDRVACLDTDPVYLMVSFARALDALGVDEAYVYSVGRDQGQTLERLGGIALGQRGRDVDQSGVEDESLSLPEAIEHRMDEAHEHTAVLAHGAGDVEQQHQPQGLVPPAPPGRRRRRLLRPRSVLESHVWMRNNPSPMLLCSTRRMRPRLHPLPCDETPVLPTTRPASGESR